ncbi:proline dehydrogenase 1, mitochondrial isoform X3 [Ctenopharyngodon idella]|uniref:proline dehydrogenase 1, mitochondrial isoform X3 n=1 Tax=Ctenopharyngodon idella TaxID=7959 RepID=UPI00222F9157|nr:proline dehydrogenase 1, mitochondrial isoform X3 [Ctenopharyngodon idella]
MSFRKTLPAFGLATRDSNIRSLVISTRHGYHHRSVQALHPTKTNTQEEHVSFSNKISIDFEQTKEAYKSKDTLELLRSLVVFKLCSYDILVDKNKEIMDLSKKLLGQKMFEQFMKMTFYGQFVAGEDHQSIRPVVQKNQAYGVGAVLDYSVEEDLSQEEAERKEMESCMSTSEKGSPGADHREKKFTAHRKFGDRREGVTSARTYLYADEVKCDQHMETFLKCIKASGGSSEDGFSAIKMTALGRPQFLLQFSEVLVKWRRFFSFLAAKQGKDGVEVLEQKLDLEQLQTCLARLGAQGNIQSCFSDGRLHSSGMVDMLDWNSLIDERTKISDLLVVPNLQTGQLEPLLSKFTKEEERQMKRMLQRLDVLAKEAFDNVSMDVELSRREGWCFGAKLVRGAYMYQERSRAAEIGYEDPINPDYECTNRMYHRCLDYVLEEIEQNKKANVMVASHNLDTVKHTLRRMNEMGLAPTDKKVYFGQLLGMCDQISFPLAQAGFPVYKYVPYGPLNEVIPYLSRRAQENRGIMKGVQMERDLLWKELMRRLSSGEVFYTPAV